MIEDVLVGGEDSVREPVVAHKLPDVLHRVQLRGLGRERQERDVRRHFELGRDVPAGLIKENDGVSARGDRL